MSSSLSSPFDAVILAGPVSPRVCGLTLAERARRVAVRAGATSVWTGGEADAYRKWIARHPERPLLVIDATSQVVHLPLVAAVRPGDGLSRIAIGPDGELAGAVYADPSCRDALAAAAREPAALAALARSWRVAGVDARAHGELARHPAATPAERRAATRFLFGLVRKPQDSPLVRAINRRVSYPFTRALLPTPITPNMISFVVFLLGALGCVILASPGYASALAGTAIILFASYLDGCDGEVARIRLETSKLGAWLDTLADEATSIMFVGALGVHVYREHPSPVIAWTIPVAVASAMIVVYVLYYYLIVVAHSGNSQDYPKKSGGMFEPLRRLFKRDFITLSSVVLAAIDQTEAMYAAAAVMASVSAVVMIGQHVQLRRSLVRAAPARSGELPAMR